MSIERPLFYEGQILAAADLTLASDHSRGQTARHERYLHLWGIAHGLELTSKEKKVGTDTYLEITLSAGMAIDATGREIVVDEDELLPETGFIESNVVAKVDDWYPVFLIGLDKSTSQASIGGACASGSSNRIKEDYAIQFGRPEDALDWEKQPTPKAGEGPGGVVSRLLLGFVQWDKNNPNLKPGRFVKLDAQRGRQYAGVKADVVSARSGKLELRTYTDIQNGKPALVMDEDKEEGPRLRFGLLTAEGELTSVFKITAKGYVESGGSILGGTVLIESGIATDGIILPLPPGITEEQVTSGQAKLHIQATPMVPGGMPPDDTNTDWVAIPHECQVASDRRVSCLIRWFRLTTPATTQILPGACNYTVLASVSPATGAIP